MAGERIGLRMGDLKLNSEGGVPILSRGDAAVNQERVQGEELVGAGDEVLSGELL